MRSGTSVEEKCAKILSIEERIVFKNILVKITIIAYPDILIRRIIVALREVSEVVKIRMNFSATKSVVENAKRKSSIEVAKHTIKFSRLPVRMTIIIGNAVAITINGTSKIRKRVKKDKRCKSRREIGNDSSHSNSSPVIKLPADPIPRRRR